MAPEDTTLVRPPLPSGVLMRGFCFMVAFWGDEHRSHFTDWLVPSLLTAGNIPALDNKIESKFLIATSESDWIALHNNDNFLRLCDFIEPLKFPLDDKLQAISRCGAAFALMTDYAHALGLYGVTLTPDQLWANNNVVELQSLARDGYGLVLFPAARLNQEKFFAALGDTRDIGAPQLSAIATRSLHAEWDAYEWEGPYYPDTASDYFQRLPDGGILRHATAWQPLLIDYERLVTNDLSSLAGGHHYDGGYVWDNYAHLPKPKAICDDRTIFAASFTPEAEGPQPKPMPTLASSHKWFCRAVHADAMRNTLRLKFLRHFPPELLLSPVVWNSDTKPSPLPLARHIGKKPKRLLRLWRLLFVAQLSVDPDEYSDTSRFYRLLRRLWRALKGDPQSREIVVWHLRQILGVIR